MMPGNTSTTKKNRKSEIPEILNKTEKKKKFKKSLDNVILLCYNIQASKRYVQFDKHTLTYMRV